MMISPMILEEILTKVELEKLELLDLQNLGLKEIPEKVFSFTWLKELRLGGNNLSKLSPLVGALINLETIVLINNQLEALPSEIGNLSSLENIYITYNRVKTIPKEVGNLSNLKRFFASDNLISSLPSEFGNLLNLQHLHLANNKLNELPNELIKLVNLATNKETRKTRFVGLDIWQNNLSIPSRVYGEEPLAMIKATLEEQKVKPKKKSYVSMEKIDEVNKEELENKLKVLRVINSKINVLEISKIKSSNAIQKFDYSEELNKLNQERKKIKKEIEELKKLDFSNN